MKHLLQTIILFLCLLTLASCQLKPSSQNVLVVGKDSSANTPRYRMGERIKLWGDFNGDGKTDTVYESYISSLTGAETYKDMDSTDWEGNIGAIIKNKPVSRLYTNIKGVDTFVVTDVSQLRGLMVLDNLGDICGDKGDEIGYVIDWADYSNINSYHILTLSGGKWKDIYSFQIHESINLDPQSLFDSIHLVKAMPGSRIRYRYYTDMAEVGDTIVTLK